MQDLLHVVDVSGSTAGFGPGTQGVVRRWEGVGGRGARAFSIRRRNSKLLVMTHPRARVRPRMRLSIQIIRIKNQRRHRIRFLCLPASLVRISRDSPEIRVHL